MTQPLALTTSAQAQVCDFHRLLTTPALLVGDFHCPGTPPVTAVEAAPHAEIVLARRGAYVRRDEAGSVYIDRTVVAFFEAQRPYVIEHPRPRPDQTTVISLVQPEAVCASLGLAARSGRCFARSALRASPELHLLHRNLLLHLRAGATAALAAEECAVLLANAAVALNHGVSPELAYRAPAGADVREATVAVAIAEYLNGHYRERVALEAIARHTGYSVFHLCRLFQARMKTSIHQYLLTLRLQAAVEALVETDVPIVELALALGFSSHSHFTAAFSRWTGVSPRAARQQGRMRTTRP